MIQFIIIASVCWLIGVFGWAQIIGSLQNIAVRKNLFFTMILWIAIVGVGAYFAITKFDGLVPMLVGYGISLVQVLSAGRIS